MKEPLALYRVRIPLGSAAAAILIINALTAQIVLPGAAQELRIIMALAAVGIVLLCLALAVLGPNLLCTQPAQVVAAPVRGRWAGLNSPASKVPSHGTRGYGQSHAIDIVYEPGNDQPRPQFGGAMMRPAQEYPAYGQPVFAMVDGTVVRASGWRRDHRARSNLLGFAYMIIEALIRQLGGPGFLVGNHVTIRCNNGIYAMAAHLQQGSLRVKVGDRVSSGDHLGNCGNSGNTSEPHVHAQLMDRASLWTAQGIPMEFANIALGDNPKKINALPKNGEYMSVDHASRSAADQRGGVPGDLFKDP